MFDGLGAKVAEFHIRAPLQPKKRPRLGRHNVHNESRYTAWKARVRAHMAVDFRFRDPIERAAVFVDCQGEARSDADNIIGALLDAGSGLVWKDDRLNILPTIGINWTKAKKANSEWRVLVYERL